MYITFVNFAGNLNSHSEFYRNEMLTFGNLVLTNILRTEIILHIKNLKFFPRAKAFYKTLN